MDVGKAKLDAFVEYEHRFEEFNHAVRASAASLILVEKLVRIPGGDVVLGRLVDATGMPWSRNARYPRPADKVRSGRRGVQQGLLFWAVSEFAAFVGDLIADVAAFGAAEASEGVFPHAHVDAEYRPTRPWTGFRCCDAYAEQFATNHRLYELVERLAEQLGGPTDGLGEVLPLFHYFRVVRNCLAHRGGRADSEFVELVESQDLSRALECFNASNRKPAPSLPQPREGDAFELTEAHSILAAVVCMRVARELNCLARDVLGREGLMRMAAFNGILFLHHHARAASYALNDT